MNTQGEHMNIGEDGIVTADLVERLKRLTREGKIHWVDWGMGPDGHTVGADLGQGIRVAIVNFSFSDDRLVLQARDMDGVSIDIDAPTQDMVDLRDAVTDKVMEKLKMAMGRCEIRLEPGK